LRASGLDAPQVRRSATAERERGCGCLADGKRGREHRVIADDIDRSLRRGETRGVEDLVEALLMQ
jgi:hypothetical protein